MCTCEGMCTLVQVPMVANKGCNIPWSSQKVWAMVLRAKLRSCTTAVQAEPSLLSHLSSPAFPVLDHNFFGGGRSFFFFLSFLWTLGLFFYFPEECHYCFDVDYVESVDSLFVFINLFINMYADIPIPQQDQCQLVWVASLLPRC